MTPAWRSWPQTESPNYSDMVCSRSSEYFFSLSPSLSISIFLSLFHSLCSVGYNYCRFTSRCRRTRLFGERHPSQYRASERPIKVKSRLRDVWRTGHYVQISSVIFVPFSCGVVTCQDGSVTECYNNWNKRGVKKCGSFSFFFSQSPRNVRNPTNHQLQSDKKPIGLHSQWFLIDLDNCHRPSREFSLQTVTPNGRYGNRFNWVQSCPPCMNSWVASSIDNVQTCLRFFTRFAFVLTALFQMNQFLFTSENQTPIFPFPSFASFLFSCQVGFYRYSF